jgi:radical SAM-linked protein
MPSPTPAPSPAAAASPKRQPDLAGRQVEVVQHVRLRFAKRGRLRFASHRDVARAFERAIRRAGIPIAYSSGFTAHPRISWAGAAPTGAASEAEYVELGLAEQRDPAEVVQKLDTSLAPGIDVLDGVVAQPGTGKLAERIDASQWELQLNGIAPDVLEGAVARLLAAATAPVERLTKDGRKTIDVRAALASASVTAPRVSVGHAGPACAILGVVVRQTTPVVRPDDVVAALSSVAGLPAPLSSLVTRLAQGQLLEDGSIVDPLAADRVARAASPPVASHER